MNALQNFRRMAPGRKALFLLGAVFCILYFGLGAIFLFAKNLPFNMSPGLKTGFGILLVAYSLFRFSRLLGDLKKAEE